jgi:hypothetical protein
MDKKYHAHRVDTNIYEYRGFQIECVGYYPPEHRVVWEALASIRKTCLHLSKSMTTVIVVARLVSNTISNILA